MIKKVIVKKAKYIPVRMPIEAYKNYVRRQERMESVIRKLTRKKINIPLTKVFRISSEIPINFSDEYLLGVAKRRKK